MISAIAQWVVLLCLGLVALAHSRLLGLLHVRLGPAGARPLSDGPDIGARLKELSGRLLDGSPWCVRFPRGTEIILIFISPQCQTCNALMPHVKDFVRALPNVPVTLVSTIDNAQMNRAYISYRRIEELPYVLSEKMSEELGIEGTPYALRIGEDGRVIAKGIVNSFENLMRLNKQSDGQAREGMNVRATRESAILKEERVQWDNGVGASP
jgi:methylamine dehydrogenase accessory protein MauD